MDLEPKPLKKEIFDKARELGITEIHLEFQGGSDEGYVYINCIHPAGNGDFHQQTVLRFQQKIEDWVWQVYDYSGAGDGTDYGDNITYKVGEAVEEDGTWKIPTTSQDWYHQPEYGVKVKFEMGLQSQENEK